MFVKKLKKKQEGHDGPESLTRNNCFSVLECQYLNNNLKKCHDLGYLSLSLNGANQINMSKLDKRLPKNATKFSDHLSIISVGNDVQRFFLFLA
jgi:hypothetical protein